MQTLSLDPDNWLAQFYSGYLFFLRKEHDNAIQAFKKAIELNPNNADSYGMIGFVLNFSDTPLEALDYLNFSLRLSPVLPAGSFWLFGVSYAWLRRYDKAIEFYKECLSREPNFWPAYVGLATVYSRIGQEYNARRAIRQLLNLFPDYSIKYAEKTSLYKTQDQLDRALQNLRNAGVPE